MLLVVSLAGCDRPVPVEAGVPADAEYTGGRYKSGWWRHCEPIEKFGTHRCTEHSSDGKLQSIGEYTAAPDYDSLRNAEKAAEVQSSADVIYFKQTTLFPISLVIYEPSGTPYVAYFMPADCRNALLREEYERFVDLVRDGPAIEDGAAKFRELFGMPGVAEPLAFDGNLAEWTMPTRAYHLGGCRIQFHWD